MRWQKSFFYYRWTMKQWSSCRNYINNRRTFDENFSFLAILFIYIFVVVVVVVVVFAHFFFLSLLLFRRVLIHSLFQIDPCNTRMALGILVGRLVGASASASVASFAFHRFWLFIMYYCSKWLTSQLYTLSTSKLWWSIISLLFSIYVCIMVMLIFTQGFWVFYFCAFRTNVFRIVLPSCMNEWFSIGCDWGRLYLLSLVLCTHFFYMCWCSAWLCAHFESDDRCSYCCFSSFAKHCADEKEEWWVKEKKNVFFLLLNAQCAFNLSTCSALELWNSHLWRYNYLNFVHLLARFDVFFIWSGVLPTPATRDTSPFRMYQHV